MTDLVVGPDVRVTLHFALKLVDGTLIDSNFDGNPATFVVGDGSMLQGFEEAMFGLRVGDKQHFNISPEKGFGQHNPSNLHMISRGDFPEDIELEEGVVLNFTDPQNTEMPGVVVSINDSEVTVDFNHPLAGREIIFDVHIIDVSPSITH